MGEELNCRLYYLQVGDSYMPIDEIQEYSIEPTDGKSESKEYFDKGFSLTVPIKDMNVHKFVVQVLGVKERYLNKRFTNRHIHLQKYGKSKRVRQKNWKRTFGKFGGGSAKDEPQSFNRW